MSQCSISPTAISMTQSLDCETATIYQDGDMPSAHQRGGETLLTPSPPARQTGSVFGKRAARGQVHWHPLPQLARCVATSARS